jgi:hypothetical protein
MVRRYNTRKRCDGSGRCGVGHRVANGGEGFAGAARVAGTDGPGDRTTRKEEV